MPGGPLAHICFLVRDLDQAIADWKDISFPLPLIY